MMSTEPRGIGAFGRPGSKSVRTTGSANEIVSEARSRSGSRPKGTSFLDLRKERVNPPPPVAIVPDPKNDFGTYRAVSVALEPRALIRAFERMRSEIGTLGFATQNAVSELSHEGIARVINGDWSRAENALDEAIDLWNSFKESEHHLPDADRTQFGNNAAQELVELILFMIMFPVVTGEMDEMSKLPSIRQFEDQGIHVQAVLAGYKDVVSELSKGVLEITANPSVTPERRLELNQRWLTVAESTILVLSKFKGFPNSVTTNFFGSRRSWSDGMRWLGNLVIRNRQHYETLVNQAQLEERLEQLISNISTETPTKAD